MDKLTTILIIRPCNFYNQPSDVKIVSTLHSRNCFEVPDTIQLSPYLKIPEKIRSAITDAPE